MKNGLFIELYDFKEVVLKNKGPVYFVKIEKEEYENELSVINVEKETQQLYPVNSYINEQVGKIEKEYSFYVKCFNCNEEHFLFINESLFENELSYLSFLKYQSSIPRRSFGFVKSITKTNDELVIEKIDNSKNVEILNKIGIACPCCKENNINFAGRNSIHLFLNENDKFFEIKSYSVSYVSKNVKMNHFTSLYNNQGMEDLNIIAMNESNHFIFDKKNNNIYYRYSNGGKYHIRNGKDLFENYLKCMKADNEELFISFFKKIILHYHNKFNEYQINKMNFKKHIDETNDMNELLRIFNKVNYHLTFPFAFELFGEEVQDYIENESRYFKDKIKKAKSGDEILNIYLNGKGLTKKIKEKIKSNPSYFDIKNRNTNKVYEYFFIKCLVNVHDNKGLNELIFNKLLDEYNYLNISRFTHIKDFNYKILSNKKVYSILKKYILIDDVLKMYLTTKNPYEYNSVIRDTINLIILIEDFFKKKDEEISSNQKKAVIEAKKSIKIIQKNKNLSLVKLHDKLSLLYEEINTVFEEYIYTDEEVSLNYKEDNISINLYENSIQLKQSASKLKICAYSYSNRIKNKEIVLFELKEDDKEKMCIEVKGNKIIQAKLNSNKQIDKYTSKNLVYGLKSWIKAKDLEVFTHDLDYIK